MAEGSGLAWIGLGLWGVEGVEVRGTRLLSPEDDGVIRISFTATSSAPVDASSVRPFVVHHRLRLSHSHSILGRHLASWSSRYL